MQSNNPVFTRSESFNGKGATTYAQTDPSSWGVGSPTSPTHTTPGERMTIDSVVQKTGITLAIVLVTAVATWLFTGDINNADNASKLYGALLIGSLGAFALSMVNSFKRVISPPLVIAFAALEGVALGALSKFFESMFPNAEGLVTQAVIGTFAAFAGTLAAYKFFNIQVGAKFRTFVISAMFGMIGLAVLEMVLGAFGNQLGLLGFGGMGLLFSVVGLVLGVLMLIMDFDFVEKGVAAGIPEAESWRAAFALTVSLVWIYTNLLRILAIFSQD